MKKYFHTTQAPSESEAKESVHRNIHVKIDPVTFHKMMLFAFHEEEYASCCLKSKIINDELIADFVIYSFTINGNLIHSYVFTEIYKWEDAIELYLAQLEIVKKVNKNMQMDKKLCRKRI